MNKNLLALFLVCLSISMLTGFELVQVLATPAPSINSVCEPGGCSARAAAYIMQIDPSGPTYLATNGVTGINECISTTDFAVTFNCAVSNLASKGGLLYIKQGVYTICTQMLINTSNIWVEGEGGSADNAASYPNADYQGTIILAGNCFPTGASLANPKYMILVGGNGLKQAQGGGIERMSIGSTRGYGAGNIGGIAMGFALKFTLKWITFGVFNQAISPTDYDLNGPAIAFDAALSNPTQGGPTGGWFTVETCEFNKDGGEEVIRFASATISDTLFSNDVFFGQAFNNGYVYITSGTGIRFENSLFYSIGSNNTPAIWVNGVLTGLWVTNCAFEQQVIQAGAGNTAGFIQIKITGDQFLDNSIGVNFLDNSYFIESTITTPMKYIYQINQTTANAPIHELGDIVVDLGTSITYFSNNVPANFANVVFELPSVAIGTTLPARRGPLTAGASVFTYTDNDGYPEWFNVVATNGMSALTWKGVIVPTTAGLLELLNPGDAMALTWVTTAPTYDITPASIAI